MLKPLTLLLLSGIIGCLLHSRIRNHSGADENCGAVATDLTAVKVAARRDGTVTRFYVQNSERSEVTMTFDFFTVNMKGDIQFPYTATFGPGETEAFALSPVDSESHWQYSYTNYYKLGSSVAVPDSFVYLLPYESGTVYRVSQGYNGGYSHKGANQYAVDWKMPEGTPVRAARGGLVVKIKDDSDKGGNTVAYDRYNNYVLIRHEDGTLGHYCHLQKGGVRVTPGEVVKAGDFIALSGNTGFSSGPHLHFCVFKTRDGKNRESIPVQFRVADRGVLTLAEGRKYKASDVPVAQTVVQQPPVSEIQNARIGTQGEATVVQ
jgi:murein DD-endopeptidase MepM/ murein hydrolase activator NlpD